jgi:hypothetical protein
VAALLSVPDARAALLGDPAKFALEAAVRAGHLALARRIEKDTGADVGVLASQPKLGAMYFLDDPGAAYLQREPPLPKHNVLDYKQLEASSPLLPPNKTTLTSPTHAKPTHARGAY